MSPKKSARFSVRKCVMFVLAMIMVISGIGVVQNKIESNRQRQEQERLERLAMETTAAETTAEATEAIVETETVPEETEPPYVSPINFEALRAENPDVVGWITIPDTRIDYPIVQTDNNETYLDTDFSGKESVYGAIYLDCDSDSDFSGWNHPIYGHHMRDGSMFKDVVKFKDEEFFKEHQYFEIYTPERTIHLKAVSCYYTGSDGIVRKTRFDSQESFNTWLQSRLEPCPYAQIPEEQIDSVFVLVTCSYETTDARTLLFAVEVDEEGNIIAAEE